MFTKVKFVAKGVDGWAKAGNAPALIVVATKAVATRVGRERFIPFHLVLRIAADLVTCLAKYAQRCRAQQYYKYAIHACGARFLRSTQLKFGTNG